MKTDNQIQQEQWEKEFDKKFLSFGEVSITNHGGWGINEIKQFISQTRQEAVEEERTYISKTIPNIIINWGKEYGVNIQLLTYLLGDLLQLYKNKALSLKKKD